MSHDEEHFRKTALVTGASSGIGLELAKLFARDGYNLVLVARSREKLAQLGKDLKEQNGVSAYIIAKDLSVPSAPDEIHDELQKHSITIDVLVNCAGLGMQGSFSEIDLATELNMLQVNIVALTKMTKLFLNDMIARRNGGVLNVASTAAFQPGPLMAVYYATKAYVLSFSEALAEELRDSGVKVTALCPGPTRTDFQSKARAEELRLLKNGVMDAETVAKAGFKGLKRKKTVVIPGFRNRVLAFGVRLVPRDWVTKVARRMNEKA